MDLVDAGIPTKALPSKKALMDKISSLGPTEHAEIFRILKRHGVHHTQNKNGVFVNITNVSAQVIKEIAEFVQFCFQNNKELEEYDKRLNQCKLYQNLDCLVTEDHLATPAAGMPPAAAGASLSSPANKLAAPTPKSLSNSMVEFLEKLDLQTTVADLHHTGPRRQHTCNTKYAVARKKYSKRVVADLGRKAAAAQQEESGTGAVPQDLKPEPYLL